MNAIVSVTADWGIGFKNHLLVRNKADMHRFVKLTMGGTVVMGKNTFLSLPAGPLKGRRNIVVSGQQDFAPAGVEVVPTPEAALLATSDEDPNTVWLIGGARLYAALLSECDRAFVTRNACTVPADVWFPNLDESKDWVLECVEDTGTTQAGIDYDFATYIRI